MGALEDIGFSDNTLLLLLRVCPANSTAPILFAVFKYVSIIQLVTLTVGKVAQRT